MTAAAAASTAALGLVRLTAAPQMRGQKPAEERRARWARLPRRRGTEGVDYRIAIVRAGEGCERADPRGARRVAWKGPVSEQLLQHPRRHAANGVADKIDRVRLVPLWEGTVALVTAEARVVAPAGVLSAVVNHAALERVEYGVPCSSQARSW